MATLQETFDKVVNGLRKQGKKAGKPCQSANNGFSCMYLDKDGNKCAAGQLIPPEKYDPSFEGTLVFYAPLRKVLSDEGHDLELVSRLQRIHDNKDVSKWEDAWKNLAIERQLVYTPLDKAE